MENNNERFGGDYFIYMLLITIKTFFRTFPFTSDKEYVRNFTDNFREIVKEVNNKYCKAG